MKQMFSYLFTLPLAQSSGIPDGMAEAILMIDNLFFSRFRSFILLCFIMSCLQIHAIVIRNLLFLLSTIS